MIGSMIKWGLAVGCAVYIANTFGWLEQTERSDHSATTAQSQHSAQNSFTERVSNRQLDQVELANVSALPYAKVQFMQPAPPD